RRLGFCSYFVASSNPFPPIMANLLLCLLLAVFGLLIPHPAAAIGTNYLLSGQTLDTDGHLKNGDYDFIMQDDCNLVLYNGNWQSNTANRGRDCKLTLTNFGELLIKKADGSTVWSSGSKSSKGEYATVVHPEGKVVVYGPAIFKINPWVPGHSGLKLGNIPRTANMLFSGESLYEDGKLIARNHQLVMQGDCNLVLYGGKYGWQSNTHGNGQHCFLRLNHRGELIIKDDAFNTVWNSGQNSGEGDYVFILQDNGFGVVYGPAIWSTSSKGSMEKAIGMVTEAK
ncbi:hypothetical protein, partial [Streptococcus anginosus]|uniref:hypothetical protein n=1 Tax=Streptococcus anginosus TaxID=1328 RepID=UPI00398CEC23